MDYGTEDSNSATIYLTTKPVNDPPVISGTPATSIYAGEYYSFEPVSEDPDAGDLLRFSIENKPGWADFDSNTGSLTGNPF